MIKIRIAFAPRKLGNPALARLRKEPPCTSELPSSAFPGNQPVQALFLRSPPTKTSFGTDWKKQISFPTNDSQKLFLENQSAPSGIEGGRQKDRHGFPQFSAVLGLSGKHPCFLNSLRIYFSESAYTQSNRLNLMRNFE